MASLFDAVERPRVIINTNDFDKPKSLADAIEREPEVIDGIPDHHKNILQSTVDKLFGLHGEERYQLWPERLVRDAVSAPHDVMTGQISTHEVDPITGEVHTSSGMIKAAQDVSALAGTGGLAGAGNEAGMALGSGPIRTWWHGSPSGDLRGGASGLHLGTKEAAKQALEARIGIPADGLGWTGDRVYGETLLAGKNTLMKMDPRGFNQTGYNARLPEEDFYPSEILKYADGSDMPMSVKPSIREFKLKGEMSNTYDKPHEDFKANGYMRGQLKKGTAKKGYYYKNVGEDADSISIVVPNGDHVTLLSDTSKPGAALQANKPFYSAVENAVTAAKQPKADAQQWLSFLKNQPGVKQEELNHLGLDKLSGSITKDDLLKAVQEGQPQIKEIIKGGKVEKTHELDKLAQEKYNLPFDELNFDAQKALTGSQPTKYHSYQLPGGSNYREMLLTLPQQSKTEFIKNYKDATGVDISKFTDEQLNRLQSKEHFTNNSYKSSHWEEPNVLAHIRMNDRNIDGKKSLHIEEIQSDWHQEGRKKGYATTESQMKDEMSKKYFGKSYSEINDADRLIVDNTFKNPEMRPKSGDGVPDAPFKKTWDELALKKAITHAVKNGYDSISWTPGEAQAARYDLSKQVDAIRANKNPDGTYQIGLKKPGHNMGRPTKEMESVPADKLADFVGKELAEKIIRDVVKPNEHGKEFIDNGKVYSGLDLKVGGQGMKAFYDKMLVDKMNKLISKYDSKVKMVDHNSMKVPTVDITPKLKEKVLKEGFPLFSSGLPIFTPVNHDPFKKDK